MLGNGSINNGQPSLGEIVSEFAQGVDWDSVFDEAQKTVDCINTPADQRPKDCFKLIKTCWDGTTIPVIQACPEEEVSADQDKPKTSTPINPWLIAGGLYLLLLRK